MWKKESPPAWTQEAYHPLRSKCSLCPMLGGTPSQVQGGYPIPGLGGRVPHPRSWGVPCLRSRRYPIPGLGGFPIPGLGGTPSQGQGSTLSQVQGGYPTLTWMGRGVPHPDLGFGTPPARPGMGYPLPPDLRSWDGVSPPTSVDRYTDWCQNITFPRTTYAGGKNTHELGVIS